MNPGYTFTTPSSIKNFKVGDKVRQTMSCSQAYAGEIYELEEYSEGSGFRAKGTNCNCGSYWELVVPIEEKLTKNKIMKTLKGLMSRLLDKDTQVLYKADYINGDLELTEKGKKVLMELLFLANKVELVKQAEVELAEAEKNK